jgi:hypothetical protein
MRQHSDATTTEDIAAVEERPDPDSVDSDRTAAGRIESEHGESDPVDLDRSDSGRIDSEPVTSEPVAVDETARPADTTAAGQAMPRGTGDSAADLLFDEADADRFRARWREVQSGFVDDPRNAVQDADLLVAELLQEVASAFSQRKRVLEDKWREGTDAETEDLRLALRGYRSFFDQLLAH